MIEPSIPVYGTLFDEVEVLIEQLLNATGVRFCMLVDRKGFVLSHKEALWAPRPPALDSVASLVASNASATSALAGLLGESTFSEQVHQGEKGVLYIESVGSKAMLVLIFDMAVPIGRVKVYAKKTTTGLLALLSASDASAALSLGPAFSDRAEALLGELLG